MTPLIITNCVGINFGTIQFQVQKPTTHAGNGVREPSSLVRRVRFDSPARPASRFPPEQMDILQEIPFTIPIEGGEQLTLTLPKDLTELATAEAAQKGVTVAKYLVQIIMQELERRRHL